MRLHLNAIQVIIAIVAVVAVEATIVGTYIAYLVA